MSEFNIRELIAKELVDTRSRRSVGDAGDEPLLLAKETFFVDKSESINCRRQRRRLTTRLRIPATKSYQLVNSYL